MAKAERQTPNLFQKVEVIGLAERVPKRDKKTEAEGYWECSVCTFRNNAEAFKCSMCDVRKGTSTRKPRLNSQLVAQQVAQQFNPPQPKPLREKERGEKRTGKTEYPVVPPVPIAVPL
ncbi:YY1-associated factor 2 [Branchiostoma belcheri]|nr:YY1-associated factor 2 [Branchiostoma belcheri]